LERDDPEFKDENVFGLLGLTDDGTHYFGMAGMYDFFWALKPEARLRLARGWIDSIEAFISPTFIEESFEEPITGSLYVFKSDVIVEEKLGLPEIEEKKGVVIPFRPKQ
jgi:hypothetical protein